MKEKARGYAHRVDIVADARDVWRAFTEVEHLARWCSPGAQIWAKPGGLFRASIDRVTELEAHIDVFEPQRRIRLIYLPTPTLPPTDSAIVDDFILDFGPLETGGQGTIVRVLGSGIPPTAEWQTQYQRMRMGWQAAMTRLKVYVERQMRDREAS